MGMKRLSARAPMLFEELPNNDVTTAPQVEPHMALIFSSMPGSQLLARSEARYFFCA